MMEERVGIASEEESKQCSAALRTERESGEMQYE